MTFDKRLYALQIKTKTSFEANLEHIKEIISQCGDDAVIVTPEVALSGFCYQRMDEASEFSRIATEVFLELSSNSTIITTMIEKYNNKFFNNLKVFSKGVMVHKQSKSRLFPLGDEHNQFSAGDSSEICLFEVDGIKCGALNCFEIRFNEFWNTLRGADIIFVTGHWGEARREHWDSLNKALAISNQAFVVCANSANTAMAKGSAIISPYGVVYSDDNREIISLNVNLNEVRKMRKYINIGLL